MYEAVKFSSGIIIKIPKTCSSQEADPGKFGFSGRAAYEKIKRKGVKDAELSASNSEMKRKKSIISFLALFVMALAMIFTGDRTVQAAQVSSITSGDEYVIVSNGYALTASGNSLTGTKYTDGQTEITDSMKWKVTQSGEDTQSAVCPNNRYVRYSSRKC